jgi:hypothetical protein
MTTQYRSEDDLRAVFRAEAAEVHDEAAQLFVPARPPASPARAAARRWAIPVAAAAAVAVIAVPLAFVRMGHHATPANDQLGGVPLAFTFSVAPVSGWRVTPDAIHATYQDAVIAQGDNDMFGDVTVSAPGAFDPRPIASGEQVTINGHQGYFGESVPVNSPAPGGTPVPTVAWQVAPDQWATVTVSGQGIDVRDVELQIARAVSLTTPTPMRLPFRTGWLPDTARSVTEARSSVAPSGSWSTLMQLGGTDGSLQITEYAVPSGSTNVAGSFEPNTTVGGHPAQYSPRLGDPGRVESSGAAVVTRTPVMITGTQLPTLPPAPQWPSLKVDLGADVRLQVTGDYSQADLMHVAESLTLSSNPNDPTTWFDQTQ